MRGLYRKTKERRLILVIELTYIFKNNLTNDFLYKLEKLYIITLESNLVIKNWFNYTKEKYNN